MRWIITEPSGVAAALSEGLGTEPRPRLLSEIVDRGPFTRIDRLDVYAEAYYSRLLEVLESDFGTLKRLVGENIFRGLVVDYLKVHPSRSYTAAELGRELPNFVRGWELSEDLPYLADVAALEWAIVDSFFAIESGRLDPLELQKVPAEKWPNAKLKLSPSVVLMHSLWNVSELVHDTQALPTRSENWILIYRNLDLKVRVVRLDRLQHIVLRLLSQSLTLGELCEALERHLSDTDDLPPLMDWFQGWVQNGVIAAME